MLPKVIHYCWFGGKPLPKSAIKCISSWKKYLPGHEIVEWNESNFDVNAAPYVAEAYRCGKYAFVSDYVRFWVLYRYGGLYFDVDVEMIGKIDDIIARGNFMAYVGVITVLLLMRFFPLFHSLTQSRRFASAPAAPVSPFLALDHTKVSL